MQNAGLNIHLKENEVMHFIGTPNFFVDASCCKYNYKKEHILQQGNYRKFCRKLQGIRMLMLKPGYLQ